MKGGTGIKKIFIEGLKEICILIGCSFMFRIVKMYICNVEWSVVWPWGNQLGVVFFTVGGMAFVYEKWNKTSLVDGRRSDVKKTDSLLILSFATTCFETSEVQFVFALIGIGILILVIEILLDK